MTKFGESEIGCSAATLEIPPFCNPPNQIIQPQDKQELDLYPPTRPPIYHLPKLRERVYERKNLHNGGHQAYYRSMSQVWRVNGCWHCSTGRVATSEEANLRRRCFGEPSLWTLALDSVRLGRRFVPSEARNINWGETSWEEVWIAIERVGPDDDWTLTHKLAGLGLIMGNAFWYEILFFLALRQQWSFRDGQLGAVMGFSGKMIADAE